MKTLSQDIEKTRSEIIAELEAAEDKVTAAIEAYNRDVVEHREAIEAAISHYNEVISNAECLKSDAEREVADYIESRSEKWQESPKGLAYSTWASDFDSLYLSTIDVEVPVEMETPDFEARAAIENEWPELYIE